jgi:flagellar biogenesis protein FliO
MKSTPKWLWLPPAIAALLILGTFSMQGGASSTTTPRQPAADEPAATETEAGAPTTTAARKAPMPRTPDLWQMSSALLGVLLLGVVGIVVVKRLRQGPGAPRGANVLSLRQTLRLSSRHAVHAIEFDERIVLVGETEKGLTLFETGRLPERLADEAEVLSRRGTTVDLVADDADTGAVPKNLVIPRPDPLPKPRLPTPPNSPRPAVAETPANAVAPALTTFRNLLQKAGRV